MNFYTFYFPASQFVNQIEKQNRIVLLGWLREGGNAKCIKYNNHNNKNMNQLEFSPISQKDEESMDTFSFLHNPIHSIMTHRCKPPNSQNLGCVKMFDRLNRTAHNRKSYSFQLLKQFILFSSDEDTIEIHYKYTQFELDEGMQCLNNTYGIKWKLTVGKAFEDIRNFSRKRSVYRNPMHLQKLTNVYSKVMKMQEKQSYRHVIRILAGFIEKAIVCPVTNNAKLTVDLIETLEQQVEREEQPDQHEEIDSKPNTSNKSKKSKKNDLLKTAKPYNRLEMTDRIRPTNRWKEEVENVDSYQEDEPDFDRRMMLKSMSSQLYNNMPNYYKERPGQFSNGRAMSISVTPARRNCDEPIFQTKKKNSSMSQTMEDLNVVQNVIIIRGKSRNHNREPDRYIRVPVLSDQIKIVQVVPENKSRKEKSVNEEERENNNLETISSRQKSTWSKNEKQSYSSARDRKSSKQEMHKKMRNMNIDLEQSKYQEPQTHECLGCKYCHVLKEMESYRLQRTRVITPLSLS